MSKDNRPLAKHFKGAEATLLNINKRGDVKIFEKRCSKKVERKKVEVFLVAGGTGGHIFPALNVARRILQSMPQVQIHFLTDNRFAESYKQKYADVFASPNFTIQTLSVVSFRANFKFVLCLLSSIFNCFKLIFSKKPSKIIAFGGYVCFPALLCGSVARRQILLQEQNSVIGRVNKMFLPFCKNIYTSFNNTEGLGKYTYKSINCNTLLSQSFYQKLGVVEMQYTTTEACIIGTTPSPSLINANKNNDNFNIVILGGSLGASVFGENLVRQVVALLPQLQKKISVSHQVRTEAECKIVEQIYKDASIACNVKTFFTEPQDMLFEANLLISRAGASAVWEGFYCGAKCVFVPIPNSIKNHQQKNAEYIKVLSEARITIQPQNHIKLDDFLS